MTRASRAEGSRGWPAPGLGDARGGRPRGGVASERRAHSREAGGRPRRSASHHPPSHGGSETLTEFVRFTERGDHGCESRDLWLQLDGNEVELRRLRASLVEGRFGAPGAYELDLTPASEAEVDFLVVHVRPGRSPADVKVTGVFRCSAVVDAHEDDPLYRGGLARFFTASTERTT